MSPEPDCPICIRSDRVARASALYLAGLEQKYPQHARKINAHNAFYVVQTGAQTPDISTWEQIPKGSLIYLAKKLAPPAAPRKAPTRPIHPDIVVLAFSFVAPVFIYGILTNQPGMLIYSVPFLAGLYIFYFWQRRSLVAKYNAMLKGQQDADARIRRAIERWLWLRYCARDQVVFLPGKDAVPLERMEEVLF